MHIPARNLTMRSAAVVISFYRTKLVSQTAFAHLQAQVGAVNAGRANSGVSMGCKRWGCGEAGSLPGTETKLTCSALGQRTAREDLIL